MQVQVFRILVAEDDESTANLIAHSLEKYNFKVILVSDGMAALTKIRNQPFDLVISDINMPYLDGLTFLEKGKEFLKNTPTIVLTAAGEKENVVRAASSRVGAYILKPISFQLLLDKIKQLLHLDDTKLIDKKRFPFQFRIKENSSIEIAVTWDGCPSKKEVEGLFDRYYQFLSSRESFTALRIEIQNSFFYSGDALQILEDFLTKAVKKTHIQPDSIFISSAFLRETIQDLSKFTYLKLANFIST